MGAIKYNQRWIILSNVHANNEGPIIECPYIYI